MRAYIDKEPPRVRRMADDTGGASDLERRALAAITGANLGLAVKGSAVETQPARRTIVAWSGGGKDERKHEAFEEDEPTGVEVPEPESAPEDSEQDVAPAVAPTYEAPPPQVIPQAPARIYSIRELLDMAGAKSPRVPVDILIPLPTGDLKMPWEASDLELEGDVLKFTQDTSKPTWFFPMAARSA